ncbi:hypothetical protein LY76DRAFT_657459 [Colletotrichum caudatum]|nr:hypothetical protein LY76DRAFT_657459 [Colletotrichum caudatum]
MSRNGPEISYLDAAGGLKDKAAAGTHRRRAEPSEMPGALPPARIQWSDVRYASAAIDRSIVEINRKLEFLLLLVETKDFRGMEAHYNYRALLREQTPAGTALPNACRRLDAHRRSVLGVAQRLDGNGEAGRGPWRSTSNACGRGSEVTVSIKPGRK